MIVFEASGSDIIIRGRYSNGDRYTERRKYRPYFYAPDENGEHISLYGDKLKKIEVFHPAQVKQDRSGYKTTFESDVTYVNRYMIDEIPEIKKEPIRCAFLDIEVDDADGYPDVALADKPVISICVFDSFKKKYHVFALRPPTVPGDEKVLKKGDRNFYLFNSEENLFNQFVRFVEIYDFDLFWAWNGDSFDYPYIFKRLGDANRLSPLGDTEQRTGLPRGRIWLDLMWCYKKLMTSELESKALDYVAKKEGLGGKLEHEGRVGDLWRKDFKKFLEYNIHDVELMVAIEDKRKVLGYLDGLRRMTYSNWYDLRHNSRVLDFFMLKKAHDKALIMPNGNHASRNYESIEGARVIDPIPGLHSMVAAVDVRSLYPSAIKLGNMSPETLDPAGEITIGPATFTTTKRGFVPQVVDELWDYRQSIKKEMKTHAIDSLEYNRLDDLQTVVKFLLNSIYGILLMPSSRIFVRDIGAAVTFFGRKFNEYMEATAKSFGVEIIAGDTDSLYFKVESVEQAQEVTDAINVGIPKFIEDNYGDPKYNIIYVEFEKVYKKVFFLGDEHGGSKKKRYAGTVFYKDGKILDEPIMDIKGFDAKRSDTPEFIRTLQKQVLLDILNDVDKKEMITRIGEVKRDILSGKYSGVELAIPKGMSKLPHEYTKNIGAHIRGVIYSNSYLGTNIKRDKVKYIYTVQGPPNLPKTDVISFLEKMPEGFTIDYKKMADALIAAKFTNIFVSMGWDMIELDGVQVTKGDEFW